MKGYRVIRGAGGRLLTLSCCLLVVQAATSQPPPTQPTIDRAKGVAIKLGAVNEEHGLKQFDQEPEHKTRVVTLGGKECRSTDKANWQFYMDFDVDDKYLFNVNLPVRIIVEYFDEGDDWFIIKYDSNDPGAPDHGRIKFTERVPKGNTKAWKHYTFSIPDARFANGGHGGADFTISSEGYIRGHGDVAIASVAVISGGLQVSVEPPAVAADGESTCLVRALVVGPLGPVGDGTAVRFASSQGAVTPVAFTRRGVATATFVGDSVSGEAHVTVTSPEDAYTVMVPILPGEGRVLRGAMVVHTFEHARSCRTEGTTKTTRHSAVSPGTEQHDGRPALRLEYDFPDPRETLPRIYLSCDKALSGLPTQISVWVHGDKSWNQLNVVLSDSTGQRLDYLLGYINFQGWHRVEQGLGRPVYSFGGRGDGILHPPVRLSALVLAPYSAAENRKTKGVIHLQDLAIETLVPRSRSLVLEVETTKPDRVFKVGEAIECLVRICNLRSDRRSVTLRWLVRDEDGKTISDQQEKVDIEGHSAAPETVKLRPHKPGTYLAKFVAEGPDARATTSVMVAVR